MLKRIDYKQQQKPILLTKGQSNYNKLQREMNETPKEYNAIKKIIESNDASADASRGIRDNKHIEKISNNIQSKNVKLIPHQKKK